MATDGEVMEALLVIAKVFHLLIKVLYIFLLEVRRNLTSGLQLLVRFVLYLSLIFFHTFLKKNQQTISGRRRKKGLIIDQNISIQMTKLAKQREDRSDILTKLSIGPPSKVRKSMCHAEKKTASQLLSSPGVYFSKKTLQVGNIFINVN